MKNMFKFIGIIAIAAIIGFSFTACGPEPKTDTNGIVVKITGDFSDYKGWQADVDFLSDDSTRVAKTDYVNVTATTTPSTLTFAMIDQGTHKPFETAGTYKVLLNFSKHDEDNGFSYQIDSKQINSGSNTIQFNDFDTSPAISVFVTGNFSAYVGWKAYITLSVGSDYKAYSGKSITAEDTNVLRFPMYDYETDFVFGEPGNYFIWLWFEKEDEEDVDYKIDSKQIKKGLNTIALTSFTPLSSNLPTGMLGYWEQAASSGDNIRVEFTADTISFSGPGITDFAEYDFFSYDGTNIIAIDYEEGQITFKARLSDGKLIIEGLDFKAYNGTYYRYDAVPDVGKVFYFNKSAFTDEDALVTVKLFMKDGTLVDEKECPINDYVVFDLVLAGADFYFISIGEDLNDVTSGDFVVGKKKNLSVVYDGMGYTNPVLDLEGEWTMNDSSGKTIECYGETMSFSTDEDEAYFEIEAYDGETVYALYFEYINSVEATFKAELTDPNTLVISGIGFTETEWDGTYTRTIP